MINSGNIIFVTEMFIAEWIFLCSAEKRKLFWLRLPLTVAASIVSANFIFASSDMLSDPVYQLLRFFILFGVTVAAMALCYRLSFSALLSSCVAGYAVQHIAYQVAALVRRTDLFSDFSGDAFTRQYLLELVVFPPVYLLVFLTAGLFVIKNDWTKKVNKEFNLVSLAIVFICIGLSRFARYFGDFGSISVSLYAIVCCVLALVIQLVLHRLTDLRIENATIQLLWQDDRKQYEISKKTIDTINIKYHDLKHKVSRLKGQLPEEEIKSIRDAVQQFGSKIITGNEALDVLLTENTMLCE
ncbi:MAG: hypothetical protein J6U42_01535, partial [Lachnospiraceae bacterium]|nr:hypothetical protein [Lachnospiraceae bacterium]